MKSTLTFLLGRVCAPREVDSQTMFGMSLHYAEHSGFCGINLAIIHHSVITLLADVSLFPVDRYGVVALTS